MRHIKLSVAVLVLLSSFFASCKDDDLQCLNYEWHYEGASEPDTWATCHAQCGGQSQSPIDISGAIADPDLLALAVDYQAAPIDILNNGHTIKFAYAPGSKLTLNGEEYSLLQFHFHASSEHTTDGQHYPMEVHLVHQNPDNDHYAVIGVFVEEGSENAFLNHITEPLPLAVDEQYMANTHVSIGDFLPANVSYYTYDGSLTTPDCDETVSWFVMKTPVTASVAQIEAIHHDVQHNYRPVQALNGRVIKTYNP